MVIVTSAEKEFTIWSFQNEGFVRAWEFLVCVDGAYPFGFHFISLLWCVLLYGVMHITFGVQE